MIASIYKNKHLHINNLYGRWWGGVQRAFQESPSNEGTGMGEWERDPRAWSAEVPVWGRRDQAALQPECSLSFQPGFRYSFHESYVLGGSWASSSCSPWVSHRFVVAESEEGTQTAA